MALCSELALEEAMERSQDKSTQWIRLNKNARLIIYALLIRQIYLASTKLIITY